MKSFNFILNKLSKKKKSIKSGGRGIEKTESEIMIIKEEKNLSESTKVRTGWNKWGHSKMTMDRWPVGGRK